MKRAYLHFQSKWRVWLANVFANDSEFSTGVRQLFHLHGKMNQTGHMQSESFTHPDIDMSTGAVVELARLEALAKNPQRRLVIVPESVSEPEA